MLYKAFNGIDSISIISVLTEFKQSGGSSRVQESATVWICKEFISGPALTSITTPFTVSSNEANRLEGTVIISAEMVSHLLRR